MAVIAPALGSRIVAYSCVWSWHVQSVTKVSQMVTGRLARRPIQFERHWPGDPTTGQRGGAGRSAATAPPALDGPSPIPQPRALKPSTQVDLRYFCDRLYIHIQGLGQQRILKIAKGGGGLGGRHFTQGGRPTVVIGGTFWRNFSSLEGI